MKACIILLLALTPASALTVSVTKSYDYVIVGTGFAGLGACRTLTAKGVTPDRVLIIEAKNRTGGRCTSFSYSDVTQDLGAAFIHNPSISNSLHNLATQIPAFAKVQAWFGNQTEWYQNGTKVSAADLSAAQKVYSKFSDAVKATYKNISDTDLANVLASFWWNNPSVAEYPKNKVMQVLQLWAIDNGAELPDQSAWQYEIYFNSKGNKDYTLLPTLSAFHQYLWNSGCNATLKLGEKVIQVDYSGTNISVITDKAVYSTNKLMLSPSLGILKAGIAGLSTDASVIRFTPGLPDWKQNAINNIGFGRFQKLYVTVSKAFWDADSSTLHFTCKDMTNCYFTEAWVVPKLPNTILFWMNGNLASQMAGKTLAQLKSNVSTFLSNSINPPPIISNIFMTNWTNDPNVLGGYSYAKVGTKKSTFEALRKHLEAGSKRVWFIGEATHPKQYSYAYGAYDTGVDAAIAAYDS